MSFVVEDGTGLSTATSYLSVADFKSYWTDRGITFTESDAVIQGWLIRATSYIDLNYSFFGEIVSTDQALSFPRKYLCDKNGNELPSDEVPLAVVYATCEIGYSAKTSADLNTNPNIKSKRVGVVSVTYGGGIASTIAYPSANNYLKVFLKPMGELEVFRT